MPKPRFPSRLSPAELLVEGRRGYHRGELRVEWLRADTEDDLFVSGYMGERIMFMRIWDDLEHQRSLDFAARAELFWHAKVSRVQDLVRQIIDPDYAASGAALMKWTTSVPIDGGWRATMGWNGVRFESSLERKLETLDEMLGEV
jgi:hypothetical protein